MNLYQLFTCCTIFYSAVGCALPEGFVYLKDVDATIIQEIRFADTHNILDRPAEGYKSNQCILTRQAAVALSKVQKELRQSNKSIKVYDCYRPQSAVNDMISWGNHPLESTTQKEFFPSLSKKELISQDYLEVKSSHTRGSAVDLTLVRIPVKPTTKYFPGQKVAACNASKAKRIKDKSLDMGTGINCFDKKSRFHDSNVSQEVRYNRDDLRQLMEKQGFVSSDIKWWHFVLANEPYPNQYFNFDVQ